MFNLMKTFQLKIYFLSMMAFSLFPFFYALNCLLQEWQSAIHPHLDVTSVSESAWKCQHVLSEDRNRLFVVSGHI